MSKKLLGIPFILLLIKTQAEPKHLLSWVILHPIPIPLRVATIVQFLGIVEKVSTTKRLLYRYSHVCSSLPSTSTKRNFKKKKTVQMTTEFYVKFHF